MTQPIPFPNTDLRVFHIEDHNDYWYVARDETDALVQYADHMGYADVAALLTESPDLSVSVVADDHEITVYYSDADDESHASVTHTAREWAAAEGRSCIAQTEY